MSKWHGFSVLNHNNSPPSLPPPYATPKPQFLNSSFSLEHKRSFIWIHINTQTQMKCTAFPPSFIYGVAHFSSERRRPLYTSLPAKKNLSFLSSVQSSKLLSGRRCREGGKREKSWFLVPGNYAAMQIAIKRHILFIFMSKPLQKLCVPIPGLF